MSLVSSQLEVQGQAGLGSQPNQLHLISEQVITNMHEENVAWLNIGESTATTQGLIQHVHLIIGYHRVCIVFE